MLSNEGKAVALMKLNRQELVPFVKVAKGTSIRLPDYSRHVVEEDTTLGPLAEKLLGSADEAAALLERNKNLTLPDRSPGGIARLKPAENLPAGATLKLPQKDWPAKIAFALLVCFMLAVGAGWLLKSPAAEPQVPGDAGG